MEKRCSDVKTQKYTNKVRIVLAQEVNIEPTVSFLALPLREGYSKWFGKISVCVSVLLRSTSKTGCS